MWGEESRYEEVIHTPTLGFSRRILRDEVYDYIVDVLLEGGLEPGSSLNIDSLARQLDAPPPPWEALVQLEHTGLVRRVRCPRATRLLRRSVKSR